MQKSEKRNPLHAPSFFEVGMEQLRPYLLDPREDYPETYFMFEFNNVPFSAIGGLQAITGPKKNGKTFVLTVLIAVVVGDDSELIQRYFPGFRVPDRTRRMYGHPLKALLIDTEMEKLNSAKVMRRVYWLCGWDLNKPNDRFQVLWLRNVESDEHNTANTKRLHLIKLAIEIFSPDIVFIDGIRDIIGDFNDNEQASALVSDLMALATKRNICIWNVLHLNPRPGKEEESKMRGHLGTELGNKVSDTLACYKRKTTSGVTFTVKQMDARGKDMEDILFEITDDAGDLGIPKIYGHTFNAQNKPDHDEPQDILAWLNEAMTACEWPMSRNDIKKEVFGKIGKVGNHKKQQADLDYCIHHGYLKETSEKKGGHFMLELAEDLPF